MEDKEIERRLKESVEKIKMKDFEERWEAISDRIGAGHSCEGAERIQSAVLVTSDNRTQSQSSVRKIIIFAICSIFAVAAIILAIVLPLTLGKNKGQKKFLSQELVSVSATESSFYNAVNNSSLKVIDLSEFSKDQYFLYYTNDNELAGGSVEVIVEELGVYIELVFYRDNVISKFEIGTDYKEYTVNGYKVIYSTENAEVYYAAKAKVTKANIVYELTITSGDDNIQSVFDKLFD